MSADNGIYILKTGNQYRVAHIKGISSLYWNEETKSMDSMNSKRILDMFGTGKFTYNAECAIKVAQAIEKKVQYTEYGIVFLDANRSWAKVLRDCGKDDEIFQKNLENKETSE